MGKCSGVAVSGGFRDTLPFSSPCCLSYPNPQANSRASPPIPAAVPPVTRAPRAGVRRAGCPYRTMRWLTQPRPTGLQSNFAMSRPTTASRTYVPRKASPPLSSRPNAKSMAGGARSPGHSAYEGRKLRQDPGERRLFQARQRSGRGLHRARRQAERLMRASVSSTASSPPFPSSSNNWSDA